MAETPQRQEDRSAHSRPLGPSDTFARRHLGPRPAQIPEMLRTIGVDTSKAPPVGPTSTSFNFRDGYVKMEPHKSYPKYTRVRLKYKDMKGENKDRARRILDRAAHRLGDDAGYPEVDR